MASAIIYSQKHQLFAFKGEEFILNTTGVLFSCRTLSKPLLERYQDVLSGCYQDAIRTAENWGLTLSPVQCYNQIPPSERAGKRYSVTEGKFF